ncbi:MAG: SPOR domain-containing protein [Desulfobacterales bacterium]|nr:SPOR domain-containing protein [Desulfobacterales bacterium]
MPNKTQWPLTKREFWIAAFVMALSACIPPKQIILPEPTREEFSGSEEGTDQKREPSKKLAKLALVERPKPGRVRIVDDMMGKIHIQFSKGVTAKNTASIVRNCISFLVEEFGPPIYQGKVTLLITNNPADNGKMVWKDSSQWLRRITLNDFNLHPTQRHVLVHELFHAFYQSRQFIKVNPEFITEGLAVYAEYKYKYRGKNNRQILKILRERTNNLRAYADQQGIDFDRPFQSYGQGTIDYMYFLSGRVFFRQNPKTIKKKIRKILTSSHRTHERLPFDILIGEYALARNEDFLKKPSQETLTLPEPVAVGTDTGESSRKEAVRRPSGTKQASITSPESDTKFYVQVESSHVLKYAQETVKTLERKGYAAEYKKLGTWFKVFVGPYSNRSTAEKIKDQLETEKRYKDKGIRVREF